MQIASDYKDLLKILNKHKVRYLIIGAYAVIYYTEPRYTKDLDIWIEPEIKNAKRVYEALKEFRAPLKNIECEDFINKNMIYQIGIAPVRVDIIMSIPNVEFDVAWKRRKITKFEGINVNVIGIRHLIASKKKIRRHIDAADVESLQYSLRLIRERK